MLIKVHTRAFEDAELEPFATFDNPANMGYVMAKAFEWYREQDEEEFVIQIEVLDEQLEEARNRPLC